MHILVVRENTELHIPEQRTTGGDLLVVTWEDIPAGVNALHVDAMT